MRLSNCRLIRILSILLLISALPCRTTLANEVKESRNFAAVSWVLFDNRNDFRAVIPLAERTFCASSSFSVPKENYFPVEVSAQLENKDERIDPDSFETNVKHALDKIINESEPNLIINLTSHGRKGIICQQDMPNINHSSLAEVIIRQIKKFKDETRKEPVVWIFYSACFSGSLIDEFKKKIEDPTGPYHNGGSHKYSIKVRIITSSDADHLSVGMELLKTLHEDKFTSHYPNPIDVSSGRPIANSYYFDWSKFCVQDYRNRHTYWSSFEPLLLNRALKAMENGEGEWLGEGVKLLRLLDGISKNNLKLLMATLKKGDEETRLEAIKALRELKGDAMSALPLLRRELKNPASHTIAVESALSLVTISPNETTLLLPKIYRLYEHAEIRDKLTAVKTMITMTSLPTPLIEKLVNDLIGFYIQEEELIRNKDPKFFDNQELREIIIKLLAKYPSIVGSKLLELYGRGNMDEKKCILEAFKTMPNLPSKFVLQFVDYIEAMEVMIDQINQLPSNYQLEDYGINYSSLSSFRNALYRIAYQKADEFSPPAAVIIDHLSSRPIRNRSIRKNSYKPLNSKLTQKINETLKELFLHHEPAFQFTKTKELIEMLPHNSELIISLERALGDVSDSRVVPYLIERYKMLEKDDDDTEKALLYFYLIESSRNDLPHEAWLEVLLDQASRASSLSDTAKKLKAHLLPSDLPKIWSMAQNKQYPESVLMALGKLGDESHVPFLIHAYKEDTNIREHKRDCAIEGLVWLGKKAKAAEPFLIEMLADKDDYIRGRAAYALLNILGKDAIKLIEQYYVASPYSSNLYDVEVAKLIKSLQEKPN